MGDTRRQHLDGSVLGGEQEGLILWRSCARFLREVPMHCVNVRQLKNNPSEALRSAAEGPVLVLKGDLPEALLLHLEAGDAPEEADLRLALAVVLFKEGALSLGRAARVAARPLAELVSHLSRLGIPVAAGDRAETAAQLESLDEWLALS